MRKKRLLSVFVALVPALAGPGRADGPAVLSHVPSGAAATIVVPSISATGRQVDKLLDQLGMGLFRAGMMPGGATRLAVNRIERLGLGQGNVRIDPDGGAAVVLLDPAAVGIDIEAFVRRQLGPLTGAEPQAPAQTLSWPIVVLLPVHPSGDASSAQVGPRAARRVLDGRAVYTAPVGDFLAVGLSKQAVEAVIASESSLADTMPSTHQALLDGAGAGVHVNNRVVNPIVRRLIDTLDDELQRVLGDSPSFFALQATLVHKALPYLRTWTAGKAADTSAVRILPDGLRIDRLESYRPGSEMARALESYEPDGGVLDRLPEMPWVLAIGSDSLPVQHQALGELSDLAIQVAQIAVQLHSRHRRLDPETLAAMQQNVRQLRSQVVSTQICVCLCDAAPEPGLAAVASLEVDRPETFAATLVSTLKLFDRLIVQASGRSDRRYALVHQPGARQVGPIAVDGLELRFRDQAGQPGASRTLLRAGMARPDERTILLSLDPGGKALAASLAALASSEGRRPQRPHLAKAMRHMPEDPGSLILLHPANLSEAIARTRRRLAPKMESARPALTGQVPLAIGSAVVSETTVHHTAFADNTLLADLLWLYLRAREQ